MKKNAPKAEQKGKPAIGFVGLGIMGLAMAKNAAAKGFPVVATNRTAARRDQAAMEGLDVVPTAAEAASKTQAVVTMVTDAQAVRDVASGPHGLLKGEVAGKTWIQMSTIDERSTLAFRDQAESAGMRFLDCPVAGSKKQVEAAELILLAGGDSSVLDDWQELLLSVGKAIVHAGGVGKGTALKLCMNLIVAQMTTALCESVALAEAQGLPPAKIFEVLGNSPALNCGYFKIKERALLENDFSPAFSLANMLKDVRFMDQAAKDHRLALPVTQAVRYLMEGAVTAGHGDEDLTSMVAILKPKTPIH